MLCFIQQFKPNQINVILQKKKLFIKGKSCISTKSGSIVGKTLSQNHCFFMHWSIMRICHKLHFEPGSILEMYAR